MLPLYYYNRLPLYYGMDPPCYPMKKSTFTAVEQHDDYARLLQVIDSVAAVARRESEQSSIPRRQVAS